MGNVKIAHEPSCDSGDGRGTAPAEPEDSAMAAPVFRAAGPHSPLHNVPHPAVQHHCCGQPELLQHPRHRQPRLVWPPLCDDHIELLALQHSKAGQAGRRSGGMSRAEGRVGSLATGTLAHWRRTAGCARHSKLLPSCALLGSPFRPPCRPACLPASQLAGTHRRRRPAQHRYHHPRVAVAEHSGALANESLPQLCYRRPRPLGCLCTTGSSGESSMSTQPWLLMADQCCRRPAEGTPRAGLTLTTPPGLKETSSPAAPHPQSAAPAL